MWVQDVLVSAAIMLVWLLLAPWLCRLGRGVLGWLGLSAWWRRKRLPRGNHRKPGS